MSEYEVGLFSDEGFQRKKCPLCGKHFWTLSGKETCGEPPCEEYSFIGDSPTKKRYDLSSMRELYLSFFEKNGHARIPRYPIIARWRNDIFFTIASVSCFQPWVLNRTIDPPANPLVMSQTCLRFNDIDNVGKTGRHLTEFEMMAHHAFNTKDQQVYFKDRTVELCHKLLLELGIPAEDINYMEAEWAGGGNSGPCFEVIVRGVELATLVFMMYEDTPSGRREMDMQVVDTGYGLERFVWISQGTPNTYEAIFGDVLEHLKDGLGLEPDEEILGNYSRLAGMMNVESNADLRVLREKLASRMGSSVEKIKKEVAPFEHLYSICDHTRALMFMLNDGGVVPSNVKAGYFARLLARRALRSLKALGVDKPLAEVLGMQIDYFGEDFPELQENQKDILDLVEVEEKKYKKTLVRGKGLVEKIDSELREKGRKQIDKESLIQLYDSHGLTPEMVDEFSSLEVEIPDDFYIQVAGRHEGPEEEEKESIRIDIPDVQPTELAYYEDAYVREFKAKVLAVFDDNIVLDKTYFYPEGGGQEHDRGKIGPLEVTGVQKHGNIVVHKVRGPGKVAEGDVACCSLDWDRRYQLMQHHTVTHIINGAARRVLGNHAWQAGAHKSEVLGRLDLTHHSRISEEEKKKIEELANKIVEEDRPIDISFFDRNDAEKKYGFRIYQGGAVPGKTIRIVDVRDWDIEACGGMHFRSTGEVGGIKITDAKRIQDGVVRLEYKAGKALDIHAERLRELAGKAGAEYSEEELREVAGIFSVQVEQVPKTLERFKREWAEQKNSIDALKESLLELSGESSNASDYGSLPEADSVESARRLFSEWKKQKKDLDKLKSLVGEALSERLKERLESDYIEKEGVRIAKEMVFGLDVKNLTGLAKSSVIDGSLLVIVNKTNKKVNIVVCSKSIFRADEVAAKLSRMLGGGSHGDNDLAVGGGSAEDVEKVLEEFMP